MPQTGERLKPLPIGPGAARAHGCCGGFRGLDAATARLLRPDFGRESDASARPPAEKSADTRNPK